MFSKQELQLSTDWAAQIVAGQRDARGQEYGMRLSVERLHASGKTFVILLELVGVEDGIVAGWLRSPAMMEYGQKLTLSDLSSLFTLKVGT